MKTKSAFQILTMGISFLLICFHTTAQFTLSGEVRPRTEYLHGFGSLADSAQDYAFWTDQRTRLNFDYSSEKFRFGVVMQDIRTWGSVSQLNRTDGFTSIHQAWGQILFTSKCNLKFGRQEVIYDNHRIFGSVAWAQQARSHDLGIFQYKDSSLTLDIGLAYNQNQPQTNTNVFTVPKQYKTFQYLWLHKDFNANLGMSILALNNGLQYSETDTAGNTEYSVKFSQTAGTHISYKKDGLNAFISGYYQMGEDVTNRTINAYDVSAEVNYKVTEVFGVKAGFELLSGTSTTDTSNKENNSFNPFYGTNHKFNGLMDYFYVGNHANNVGLQDIYFGASCGKGSVSFGADVHLFSTAADLLDVTHLMNTGEYKALNSSLGTEIDVTAKYKFAEGVIFQAGYSHLLATSTMEALKGGDKDELNHWAYLMITVKPVLFKQ